MVYADAGEWQRRMTSSLETALKSGSTKKLGGEVFHHWVSFTSKRSAEEAISNARAFKFRARIRISRLPKLYGGIAKQDMYSVYVRRR